MVLVFLGRVRGAGEQNLNTLRALLDTFPPPAIGVWESQKSAFFEQNGFPQLRRAHVQYDRHVFNT